MVRVEHAVTHTKATLSYIDYEDHYYQQTSNGLSLFLIFSEDDKPYNIEVFENRIYITTYHSKSIFQMDKFGHENISFLIQRFQRANDIVVVQQNKQHRNRKKHHLTILVNYFQVLNSTTYHMHFQCSIHVLLVPVEMELFVWHYLIKGTRVFVPLGSRLSMSLAQVGTFLVLLFRQRWSHPLNDQRVSYCFISIFLSILLSNHYSAWVELLSLHSFISDGVPRLSNIILLNFQLHAPWIVWMGALVWMLLVDPVASKCIVFSWFFYFHVKIIYLISRYRKFYFYTGVKMRMMANIVTIIAVRNIAKMEDFVTLIS